MKDKRVFKINKYNTAVFLILLIIIYSIVSNSRSIKNQEKQFLDLYHNEMQVKTDLIAESVLFSLQGNIAEINNWDKFLAIISREDSIDDSSWVYVAYEGVVLYYKNHDLIKANRTISLDKFVVQLQENSIITTQSSFSYDNGTFTIGLTASKNMVLMDWGYSTFNMVLLLQIIVATLLLALIGIDFIRKSMMASMEVVRLEKEVVSLNRKVEEINQELDRITLEKESKGLSQINQAIQYDMELVRVLLMKTNATTYLPVTIIYVRFDMGNLYFTKKRMSEIEEQLRVQLVHNYELFEVGKGEFIFLLVRTEIGDIMKSLVVVEERAENIAKENGIKATVKCRTITNVIEDPLMELEKIRERI